MSNRALEKFAPEGIPEGWRQMCIGEAIEEASSPIEMRDDEEYLLASIRRRFGGLFHRERLYGREILTKNLQRVITGNFVIARMQIVHGACALADEQFQNHVISKSYSSFKSTENCDTRFFSKLAEQPFMTKYFRDASHGVVIEKMTFQQDRWLGFPVWLPPLEEQRRITEILDTIDVAIQATERVLAKYERIIGGILQRASFGFPGAEDPTFALSDFCSLSAGLTPSRGMSAYYGGDVPWVKSGEVAGSTILTSEETVSTKAVHDLGLRIVRSGTPLIAMYGATAGGVGWLEIDAATNQAVLAVEPEADRADRRWLYWALRLGAGRMLASIQGSGQPNLSKKIIGATKMPLPDLEEQLAEVERFDAAQASIEAQRAAATKLRRTRVGLTADLLAGRVRTVAA